MTTFLGTPGIGNLRGAEPFPRAARRALGDTQMRRNVGHATHTIRAKRLAAVSECADWEQLRLAGSALKQDVMARLPELLEQLERNVTARGGVVHWARDADDANRIVTDLIRAPRRSPSRICSKVFFGCPRKSRRLVAFERSTA